MPLTIWAVCVGKKYHWQHVDNLYHMVKKNLPHKFEFRCLQSSEYEGWWAKIDLHSRSSAGRNLYFDLDTIITGDLTPLVAQADNWLAMPKNWSLSGHGGFQSSVMAWNGRTRVIAEDFDPEYIGEPENGNYGYYHQDGKKLWGDQEYLTHNYSDIIHEIPPGLVVSYKYHCRQGLPENARVVCFHGKPDYWEVNDKWIKEALK